MLRRSDMLKMVEKLHNIVWLRVARRINKHRFDMLKQQKIELQKLTPFEKKEVDEFLKGYGFKYYSYNTHILVKSVTGEFNPRIIPEELFKTAISPYLNDYVHKYIYSNKNYFDLYMPNVKFPKTIVRNTEGRFFDASYRLISKDEALDIVKNYDKVVIKPVSESGSGQGVELVDTSTDVFAKRSKDFIVQELVVQNELFSKLNESSCNVVRLISVFIENEVFILSASLRVGGVGDFTDNIEHSDGSGMIVIGIDENGCLKEYGYHSNGSRVKSTPGGVTFKGLKVPAFDEMKELALREHVKFPQIGLIGWDITVDKDGEVVVMEYNTKSPGVLYYQYVNGPLFGEYTDKILSYVAKKRKK